MDTRVLHIVRGPWRRGAETFTVRLAQELHDTGSENAICSLYRLRGEEIPLSTGDLPFYRIEAAENSLDRILYVRPDVAFAMARVIRDFKPAVVLANPATLKYAALAKVMFPSCAVFFHSGGIASFWANTWWRRLPNRLALRMIDRVISVSEAAQKDFVEHYRVSPDQTCCITNGRDVDAFASPSLTAEGAELRRSLGIGPDESVMVTVGSLGPEKDQEALLSIAADLHAAGTPAHVVVAGEGPLHRELEVAAHSLGISSYTHLLGSRDDVPVVLATADVFVLPSKTEGMPGVLIEAGLAGLPSVAYDVGGVSEVIAHGETGIVIPARDRSAMTQAVSGLLSDSVLRKKMGIAASARCRATFDIREVARKYAALFEEVRRERQPQRKPDVSKRR